MKRKALMSFTLVALVLGVELWIRSQGIVNFPIYEVNESIGYIPRAGQQGFYLNRIFWQVNEKNMTAGPWKPNEKPDLLLIGDSIVWGGEEYQHQEKLGAQLQNTLKEWNVWSVGASGWSVFNEVEYLKRRPEVVEATDLLIWELNSEDFRPKSVFLTDANTPRSRPWSATAYAVRKYLIPVNLKNWLRRMVSKHNLPAHELTANDKTALDKLIEGLRLFENKKVPILILVYPNLQEWAAREQPSQDESIFFEKFLRQIEGIQIPSLRVVDGRAMSPWSEQDYRDRIHPTAAGSERLARFLASKISR